MEDAIPADMQEGFRLIRHHTVTPLAVGEVFNSVQDCHTLITEQLIDYIRMTIVHGGGITPLLKLAHLAAHYNIVRKSVVTGTSVTVRVNLGGRCLHKKK